MQITGRLTKDAQVKRTKNGRELVAFTLVINDRYKTKDGEKKDEATYFSCAYWQSVKIASHLKKGSILTLYGRVGLNAYKGKDGEYYSQLTFHVNDVKIEARSKDGDAAVISTPAKTDPLDDLPF